MLAAAHELSLPPGWEEVTLAGPVELVARFKQMFAVALAEYEAAVDSGRKP